ncbi:MAG: zinc finger protein [Patescibacteria group bacterium]|nr:zinc finger protein [Patescibacteria group bacterium]
MTIQSADDPLVEVFLLKKPTIKRVALMQAIARWKNQPCPSIKISTGTQRALICLCPRHTERTPSFRMSIGGHFSCFGCGFSGTWIDLIDLYYKPTNIEELLRIACEFIRYNKSEDEDQLTFDFGYNS